MENDHDLQPLLDVQQNQLQLLFSDGDTIDTKALAILAINVALLIFIFQSNLKFHSWWLHWLFLLPYLFSLLLDGMAIWPRQYVGASVELASHPEYLEMDAESLVLQLLADTQLAIETNVRFNRERWRFCIASIILTTIGLVALFVTI